MAKIRDFWTYFKDYLSFPWIFKENALCVILKGLALILDDVKADIVAMRNQWLVPMADSTLINDYGLSRYVPRTRFDNDEKYRLRTERAFIWHKNSGRELGLPFILEEYGYQGGIVENIRLVDEKRWAHFNINLLEPGQDLAQEKVNAVLEIANTYKPARSVIDTVSFALRNKAELCVLASQREFVEFSHAVVLGESAFPTTKLITLGNQTVFISNYNKVI